MPGVFSALSAPVWTLPVCIVPLIVGPFISMLDDLRHLAATIVIVVATLGPVGAVILGWHGWERLCRLCGYSATPPS